MAKYCIKCGKSLPEGSEMCPYCNPAEGERSAALFTTLSSGTEVWKEKEAEAPRRPANKKAIFISCLSVVAVAAICFAVIFTLPANRVSRALEAGEYSEALAIYSEKLADSEPSEKVRTRLLAAAEGVRDQLAGRSLNASEAQSRMDTLSAFGDFTDELFARVRADIAMLGDSSNYMLESEAHFESGDFMAAAASYRNVLESDSLYTEAQTRAQEAIDRYVAVVLEDTARAVEEGDYAAAISLLRAGDAALMELNTFSESIDAKLLDCNALYETQIISEAQALGETGEHAAAAEVIRVCMEDFGLDTEALRAAYEQCLINAEDKLLSDTIANAWSLYDAASYSEAYACLLNPPEGIGRDRLTVIKAEIENMDRSFAEDMLAQASAVYGGDREKLPDAIAGLETALTVRDLAEFKERIANLETLLPYDLVDDVYKEKSGEVNRNTTWFKSLSGTSFSKWMWGRDGSSITYTLDRAYDIFDAAFALRRESDEPMNAYFELWADGVKIYTSEELDHESPEFAVKVLVDISGVQELTVKFFCDYEASSAENGYSYHAICCPQVYKTVVEKG